MTGHEKLRKMPAHVQEGALHRAKRCLFVALAPSGQYQQMCETRGMLLKVRTAILFLAAVAVVDQFSALVRTMGISYVSNQIYTPLEEHLEERAKKERDEYWDKKWTDGSSRWDEERLFRRRMEEKLDKNHSKSEAPQSSDVDLAGFVYSDVTSKTECIECTDSRTYRMIKRGKSCASSELSRKCNKDQYWVDRKYCQMTCFNVGLGYEGDVCCGVKAVFPPPQPHPHAGARFPNGTWGYVADVTAARRQVKDLWKMREANSTEMHASLMQEERRNFSFFLPMTAKEFEEVCNTEPTKGKEGRGGWKLLSQKVIVGGPDPEPNVTTLSGNASLVRSKRLGEPPRVLCAIYTHPGKHKLVRAAVETWGHRCDGFFAASTETIPDDSIVDLPHYGKEEYNNMWQKTRSIWAYIHDNYLDEFDYFHLSGDDVHIIVENLRNFLWSTGGGRGSGGGKYPLYLGQWIPSLRGKYYAGGGPGYTFNKKGLRILVRDVLPRCESTTLTSSEDRMIGTCLKKIAGIEANNTCDAIGEQRYHGMNSDYVHNFSSKKKSFFARVHRFWERKTGRPNRYGLESASSQSVAFHILKVPVWLKRHHSILYRSCPRGTALGDALSSVGAVGVQ